eukprot:TRINITY_DN2537_c0_g1_i1.p1 TRINITY_DN2537_c0_g1~~TRINITY_DN2537_c0_g1_i1.p1  ORF type:complete len:830 (+),score=227.30 TRINITY_DN2537_c0_g1_i1:83-2572(+)
MDPTVKAELKQQVQRFFLEFLENFRLKTPNGDRADDYYYVEQAKTMIREGRRTLFVKVSHFSQIEEDRVNYNPDDLATAIENKYMVVRDAVNAAVPQLISKLEDKDLQEEVKKARETDELKFVVAFLDQNTKKGIRELRTETLGELVTICGTVTRTTDQKPECLVATYKCNNCGHVITGVEQQFKHTFPAVCPVKNCGNRKNWTLDGEARTTRFGDWQRIRLQENENEVPSGSMPRSMDVIVRDEITESCKPGDKVIVTGSLIVVPDVPTMMSPAELKSSVRRSLDSRVDASYGGEGVRGLSGLGQRDLTYKMMFFGCFIDEDSEWGSESKGENVRSEEKVMLSQADKDRFQSISDHIGPDGKRDCFDILAKCVAPSIHGLLEVKKGILLMLTAGLPKTTHEGIKLRGDVNVCVIGDPATAKSALLKWTSNFLPRAVYASGKTSSAAGLTASITKEAELDGEKVLEPGALMLADNGICCIDEFELMDMKDQVAIHEAMEQQTITLAKAGFKATLNARASILASVLPKDTYYDTTRPLHKNIEMTPPIMSRFDLMFVVKDNHEASNDDFVAEHILNLHMQTDQNKPHLSTEDLQRYIRLAREFKPKITPEARERLVKCYCKLRSNRSYTRGSCGITVRQLESLSRLSEAVARLHLEDQVTVAHVQQAFDLQFNSMTRVDSQEIELEEPGVDAPADAPAPEADAEAAQVDDAAAAAARRARKMKISFAEYQRVGEMLAGHLRDQQAAGSEVKEEDLTNWYMEQIEHEIQTEAQLVEQQQKVQLIIGRMIEKDRVILVYRESEDPLKPEGRVLIKHPNFFVGETIDRSRHAR